MTSEAIWSLILKEGFNVAIMAIFCYVVYKYFTKDKLSEVARQEKERAWLIGIIQDLRKENGDLQREQMEMNKLIIETCQSMIKQQQDVITIMTIIESKIDKLK